jgi:hypothetical protein
MLPPEASLPNNIYQAKKYMTELGLGYEKILVCHNGCMLSGRKTRMWKTVKCVESQSGRRIRMGLSHLTN